MIDERTRRIFEMAHKKAIREGLDLLEVLDRAGLVRSEEKINSDWHDALSRLATQLEEQPVTALVQLGGGQSTPLDTLRGVLEYIDFFKKQYLRQSGRTK